MHVEDLADLYRRVLERGFPGSIFNGAHGPSQRVRVVAEAASRAAGAAGRIRVVPVEEARKAMGHYADALLLDQQVSGELAKERLGWAPSRPDVLTDLGIS